MIRGDDQKIVATHPLHDFRYGRVETVQCFGVPFHVPSVSVYHIRVNQIHKQKSAEFPVKQIQRGLNTGFVSRRMHGKRQSP